MENESAPTTVEEVRTELAKFPVSVHEEFEKALELMPENLTDAQKLDWANIGVGMSST